MAQQSRLGFAFETLANYEQAMDHYDEPKPSLVDKARVFAEAIISGEAFQEKRFRQAMQNHGVREEALEERITQDMERGREDLSKWADTSDARDHSIDWADSDDERELSVQASDLDRHLSHQERSAGFDLEKWRADGRAYAAEHPNELRDFIARMDPGGSEPENALEVEPPDDRAEDHALIQTMLAQDRREAEQIAIENADLERYYDTLGDDEMEIAEPERLGAQVIGEFVQAKQQTMTDKDDRKLQVAPGKYPVVGAVDRDGQVQSAGIIFDAVDPQSGEQKNLVEFRQPQELAKMAQRGAIELAEGLTMAMFGGIARDQKQDKGQAQQYGLAI